MEFDPFGLSLKYLSKWNVITRCNNSRPLYTLCLTLHPATAAPMALVASTSNWHHRLSHPGVDVLSKLSNNSSVHYCRGLIPRVPRDAGYSSTLKPGTGHAQAPRSRARGLPVPGPQVPGWSTLHQISKLGGLRTSRKAPPPTIATRQDNAWQD
jgi:hypothetical protein